MKNIVILGATGSIGTQAINVIQKNQDKYNLIGISVGNNISLAKDILIKNPSIKYLVLKNEKDIDEFLDFNIMVFSSDSGLKSIVEIQEVDFVINSLIGFVGLMPSIYTIQARKNLGLANKETLVTAGHIVMPMLKEFGVNLLPIDSEHSAIFQCLNGEKTKQVKRLILTASGGSFRDKTREQLEEVTVKEALLHPNWSMGVGITIDSATMFNKALEIIEAHYLFGIDYNDISVIIHYESIVHSMVEYIDGSIIAQLSKPSMEIPISYSLSYPNRIIDTNYNYDILKMSQLNFKEVDNERYPAIKIAFEVGKKGGSYPTVLNAAKESTTDLFLNNKIKFIEIETIIIDALKNHKYINNPTINEILQVDKEIRDYIYKKEK